MTDYEITLEWERGEPLDQPANAPCANFGIVEVKFTDGRRYALNVWTFDFLPLARYPWPYEPVARLEPARFVRPPDLFVDELERRSIEDTVRRLVEEGGLDDKWLVGEPFSAWWRRLRHTGEIGPIRLGFTRFELRELWGEPDDESVRKAGGEPSIVKYGSVEFHFDPGPHGGLNLIYKESDAGVVELCIGRGRLEEGR